MFATHTLKNINVKTIAFVAAFTALSVVTPMLLHVVAGPAAGRLFLPMHLFVFVAALLLGWRAGLAVGLLAPLISYSLTGMPLIIILPLIITETALYGILAGYFYKTRKWNIILSVASAMVLGRIMLLTTIAILPIKISAIAYVLSAAYAGVIGIAIQLILIPLIYKSLKKYISDEKI
ncbi:MAG: ECF transporter S component [Parcubacteria group bacterium]|jgi:niacin transporter